MLESTRLKRPLDTPEDEQGAKRQGDPAFQHIAKRALERFVTHGILTEEQRASYVDGIIPLLQGRVTLPNEDRWKWYSETLRRIAERLQKNGYQQFIFPSKPLPERIDEAQFDTLKQKLVFDYGWHIYKMLHVCAEASLDEYEVVEMERKDPSLLPLDIKPRGPKRSTTLPSVLIPLHEFFLKRRWLIGEYQQIADDLERVLLHVWKKEHPNISDTEGMRAIPLCNQVWQLMHHEDFSGYTNDWKKQAIERFRELCKKWSHINFNSHHFSLSAHASPPLEITAGPEKNPGILAPHLLSWLVKNHVASVFGEAPAYPALVEKLYQRARSLLEGKNLHQELVACTALWEIAKLKAPLDTPFHGIFIDGSCTVPSHFALVMSKSSDLFKPWGTRVDKKVKIPLTRSAFETLYAAFIQEWPQQSSDKILEVFKIARHCQMSQFVRRLFRDLTFCLKRCSHIQELNKLEEGLQKAGCLDASNQADWQKERDSWLSNWLNNLSEWPMLEELLAHSKVPLQKVRSLSLSEIHPQKLAFVAQLPTLEELVVDSLQALSEYSEKPFSRLHSLTITSSYPSLNKLQGQILAQWVSLPCLKKLTITLQSSTDLASFLSLIPPKVAIHLSIDKPVTVDEIRSLATCTSLASLDIICSHVTPFFKTLRDLKIGELKLRLVGQHPEKSDYQQLQQLPAVRLLELRGNWSSPPYAWEAVKALPQLEIVCLGRTGSQQLIASRDASSRIQALSRLKTLELQLTGQEIPSLPHILTLPVKELIIRLKSDTFDELALMEPLFSERFHLIGNWQCGPFACTQFYVLKQQEQAVLFLSRNSEGVEEQIVHDVLSPAFPRLSHFTLNWKEDVPPSLWILQKDGKFEKSA